MGIRLHVNGGWSEYSAAPYPSPHAHPQLVAVERSSLRTSEKGQKEGTAPEALEVTKLKYQYQNQFTLK